MKTVSEKGIALIKRFEGLRTTAYRDAVGVWTIGYGHTSQAGPPSVFQGQKITAQEAHDILVQDLKGVVRLIYAVTPREKLDALPQDVFDVIVSFCFNVGVGTYRYGSRRGAEKKIGIGSVWSGVVQGSPKKIAAGLKLYNRAGGRVLPGLTKRRAVEAELVEQAVWSAPLPPPPDIPAPEPSAPTASPAPPRGRLALAGGLLGLIVTIILWILFGGALP
jgi:lysozyme